MPRRVLPDSLPTVRRALTKARDEYELITTPADRAITAEQYAQLVHTSPPTNLLSHLIVEMDSVDAAQATQSAATLALTEDFRLLVMYDSHFYQGYDRGVDRGDFPASGRAYYGRPVDATTIPPARQLRPRLRSRPQHRQRRSRAPRRHRRPGHGLPHRR